MNRMNIYHRRDGRWEGRISRGKTEEGKRKFQYILARTKEEVIQKITEIRKNEQQNEKCSQTVAEIFSEWKRSIQYRVKESTAANYTMKAEKHILPIFGDKAIIRIICTVYSGYGNSAENNIQVCGANISYFQSA